MGIQPAKGNSSTKMELTFMLLLMTSSICVVIGVRTIEELPIIRYREKGDVTIGVLTNMFSPGKVLCRTNVGFGDLQYLLAAIYGVQKVNEDPQLLGRIQLGLDVVEECDHPVAAVAQALALVAEDNPKSLSKLGLQSTSTIPSPPLIGVIGPVSSGSSIPVSNILQIFDVPLISPAATSDSLSNRDNYRNFFRMIPPDSFQTKVMVDLLVQFNWTYVSVVHSENSYGYNGITFLRRYTQAAGVCIAEVFPVSDCCFDDADYENTVQKIANEKNSNVVIIIAFSTPIRQLLQAAARLNVNHIVWILCEAAYAGTVSGTEHVTRGSFLVDWYIPEDTAYKDFVQQMTLRSRYNNSYARTAWPALDPSECKDGITSISCLDKAFGDMSDFWFSGSTFLISEAVMAYAYALETLVKKNCPEALQDALLLRGCLKPEEMIEYLYNISIPTSSGRKSFNKHGQMDLDFRIRQVQDEVRQVGVWQRQNSVFRWQHDLTWGQLKVDKETKLPESVCAKPCGPGEFYIRGELPCCWECVRCRNNEYVADNATSCRLCDVLTWPNDVTFTSCVSIAPVFLTWSDVYGLGLTALGAVGLLSGLVITGVVLKHRDRRVIKGATWPMLLIILAGVLLTFIDVALFVARPLDVMCVCNRAVFSLSCTFIFGPLLMKTYRVYLVFRASSKLTRVSKLASASAQYVIVSLIITLQVGLLVASNIFWPIRAELTMPIRTERYVELSCEQEQTGLLVPLGLNLGLLALCSIIAFLTRKLPDNFNESWYIFLSVTCTLFVWVAFLPTYYAAFFASHKAALLALALTLNGLVTLVCLFLPKIYALGFIPDKDIRITDFSTVSFESPSTTATHAGSKG